MGKYILKVESNCKDESRMDEFINWYNNTHLQDIAETKDFVKLTRYEILEPVSDKGRFVAVYEIETDNIEDTMARHGKNMKSKEALGRMNDLITVTSRGIYKQVYQKENK
jgi:hypothetical protein